MDPKEKQTEQLIRNFFVQQLSSMDTMTAQLSEPYLGQFKALKEQYNAVLKGLPPSDQAPAAMQASNHLESFFSLLSYVQSTMSYLTGELMSMKGKHDAACSAMNSVKEELAALQNKVKTGELMEKTAVNELCSAAKVTGISEGESKVRAEMEEATAKAKLIDGRKTALNAEKLPLPALEDILAGKDEDFTAAKAKAITRTKELTGKGLALNSKIVSKLAWTSDADYAAQLEGITELIAARPAGSVSGFLTPPPNTSTSIPGGCF